MTDLTIPQTRFAQKLEPFDGTPPSYVLEMDQQAIAAGLGVRHLHIVRGSMLLAYSGTREQIARCALVKDPGRLRWPYGINKPTRRAIDEATPSGLARGCLFRISDTVYAIQYIEMVPDKASIVCEGIERFDFRIGDQQERNVFVGGKDLMIARGIASSSMFSDDPEESGRLATGISVRQGLGTHLMTLEKSRRLRGEKWAYIRYPAALRLHKSETAELADSASPHEWLEYVGGRLGDSFLDGAARAVTPVRGAGRERYVVGARHIVEINQRIEAVLQGIRKLEMKAEGLVDPALSPAYAAGSSVSQADSRLKALMHSMFGRHPARAKGL